MYRPYFAPWAQLPPGPRVMQIVLGDPIFSISFFPGLLGSTHPLQGSFVLVVGLAVGCVVCEVIKPEKAAKTSTLRRQAAMMRMMVEMEESKRYCN